jgi:hypothetical protein
MCTIDEFERMWGRLGRGERRPGDTPVGLLEAFCQALSFASVSFGETCSGVCYVRFRPGHALFDKDDGLLFFVCQEDQDSDILYSRMSAKVYECGLQEAPTLVLRLRAEEDLKNRLAQSALRYVQLTYDDVHELMRSRSPRKELQRIALAQQVQPYGCPFITRGPTSADMFRGRQSEIKRICQPRGSNSNIMRSYCIVGHRKAGKTSLLYRIEDEFQQTSCSSATYITLKGCLSAFDAMQAIALRANPKMLPGLTPGIFENRMIQEKAGPTTDHVWLLDECDAVIADDLLHGERLCRSLTMSQFSRVVFAGHTQLLRVLRQTRSEFWNSVEPLNLLGLDPSSAKNLIDDTLRSRGWQIQHPKEVLNYIVQESHGLPAIVQLYGAEIWHHLSEQGRRTVGMGDVVAAERRPEFRDQTVEAVIGDTSPVARFIAFMLLDVPGETMTEGSIIDAAKAVVHSISLAQVQEALAYLEHTGIISLGEKGSSYSFSFPALPRLLKGTHEVGRFLKEAKDEMRRQA